MNILYYGANNTINDKIIEVSLKFADNAIYIYGTKNRCLLNKINHFAENEICDLKTVEFHPFYSFKCVSPYPIFYLIPKWMIGKLIKQTDGIELYDYKFELNGNAGLGFLQFFHTNFKKGTQLKKKIVNLILTIQIIILALVGISILLYIYTRRRYVLAIVVILGIIIFMSVYDNLDKYSDLVDILRHRYLPT